MKVSDHYSGKATAAQVNDMFSRQISKITEMPKERFEGFLNDILASASMKRFSSVNKFIKTLFAARVESLVPGTWRRFRDKFPSGLEFVTEMYITASEVVRENPRLFAPGNGVQAKKVLDEAVLDTIDTFMPLDEIVDAVGSQSEDEPEKEENDVSDKDEPEKEVNDALPPPTEDDNGPEISSPPAKKRRVAEFDNESFSL
jgi:hypothetical protein